VIKPRRLFLFDEAMVLEQRQLSMRRDFAAPDASPASLGRIAWRTVKSATRLGDRSTDSIKSFG
jgi:hypothetical protein